jgi:DNA-binding NarL/FixJ family response regulator
MNKIRIILADSNILIREGLKSLLKGLSEVEIIAEAEDSSFLISHISALKPDIIIIDYCSPMFKVEDISVILNVYPNVKILAITDNSEKKIVENALKAGVYSHIMKNCDKTEITDAVLNTHKGEKFFCGKVLDAIKDENISGKSLSCAPISLSGREVEIIQLIAEGLTNKQIADKLFLSTHTVMTHRKNIMNKLGINNTAGIVIYAIKENIISPNHFLFAS